MKTWTGLLAGVLGTACSVDPARMLAPEIVTSPVSPAFTPGRAAGGLGEVFTKISQRPAVVA